MEVQDEQDYIGMQTPTDLLVFTWLFDFFNYNLEDYIA